jgi:hypothetical protein
MENKECCNQSEGLCCPISGCPIKHVVILAVTAFAVMFGLEWLFHGIYMMPDYEATASLWRSEAEMQGLFGFCMIRKGLMALAIAGLFGWAGKSCGGITCPVKGAKFGLLIGLLLGANDFGTYIWMPIPMDMAIKWLIGNTLIGVVLGAVLAVVCGKVCKKS